MQQKCPRCGSPHSLGTRFCIACGTQIILSCPFCGAPVAPGYKFCGICGGNLSETTQLPVPQKHPLERATDKLADYLKTKGFSAESTINTGKPMPDNWQPLARIMTHDALDYLLRGVLPRHQIELLYLGQVFGGEFAQLIDEMQKNVVREKDDDACYEQYRKYFEKARTLLLFRLLVGYETKGDDEVNKVFNEALDYFAKSIKLNPEYARVYMYRAGLYEALRNTTSALADYKKFVELATHLMELQESLKADDDQNYGNKRAFALERIQAMQLG